LRGVRNYLAKGGALITKVNAMGVIATKVRKYVVRGWGIPSEKLPYLR
jgi:hypothetical protein